MRESAGTFRMSASLAHEPTQRYEMKLVASA
jgi:hypothetical protein